MPCLTDMSHSTINMHEPPCEYMPRLFSAVKSRLKKKKKNSRRWFSFNCLRELYCIKPFIQFVWCSMAIKWSVRYQTQSTSASLSISNDLIFNALWIINDLIESNLAYPSSDTRPGWITPSFISHDLQALKSASRWIINFPFGIVNNQMI